MKLWIDECLSPTLVARANKRGYWATCNRDRGMLGVSDRELSQAVVGEEAVLVTNDEADFVDLRGDGPAFRLLILPQARTREALWLNKRVEIGLDRAAVHVDLPSAE